MVVVDVLFSIYPIFGVEQYVQCMCMCVRGVCMHVYTVYPPIQAIFNVCTEDIHIE